MPPGVPLHLYFRLRRRRLAAFWVCALLLVGAAAWADRCAWFGLMEGTAAVFFGGRWILVDVQPGPLLEVAPFRDARPSHRVRPVGLTTGCGTGRDPAADDRIREAFVEIVGQGPVRIEVVGRVDPETGVPAVRLWDGRGVSLNERLLAAGWCCADSRADHRQGRRYRLLEEQARRDGVGQWHRRLGVAEASP